LALAQRFVAEFAFDELELLQGRIVREVIRHAGGKAVKERQILWWMRELEEREKLGVGSPHDGVGAVLMPFFS